MNLRKKFVFCDLNKLDKIELEWTCMPIKDKGFEEISQIVSKMKFVIV